MHGCMSATVSRREREGRKANEERGEGEREKEEEKVKF